MVGSVGRVRFRVRVSVRVRVRVRVRVSGRVRVGVLFISPLVVVGLGLGSGKQDRLSVLMTTWLVFVNESTCKVALGMHVVILSTTA